MYLLNRQCQYKACKNDKFNFIFKRMLFAKFTQAHTTGDLPSPLMAILFETEYKCLLNTSGH